jgi:hypothetical protein
MNRTRVTVRFLVTIVLVMAGMAVVGRAAGLAPSADHIGAGKVATPVCTSSAVTVVETITTPNVTKLTLSGIPAACAGATLQVTMAEGAVTDTPAGQTVPVGGGTMTETIAGIPVTSTAQVDIVMEGP